VPLISKRTLILEGLKAFNFVRLVGSTLDEDEYKGSVEKFLPFAQRTQ
jgi:hypothetical protein